MSPIQTLASLNEKSIDALTTVQDRIVAASKNAASVLPADRIPVTPRARDYLEQVVEESYAFQGKLLEANKRFAVGLLDAAAPAPASAKASAKAAK